MAEYQYELFNIDTENMSYLDIRQWLIDCRNAVIAPNNNIKDIGYQEKLLRFTDEWYRHYENNKDFYDDYKFSKALLSLTARPITVKAIIGKKKITLDNVMSCITAPERNPFAKMLEQTEESILKKSTSAYYNDIKDCFAEKNKSKYKEKLDKIIRKGLVSGACYEIKVFEKTTKARAKLLSIETEEELKGILNAPDTFTEKMCVPKLTLAKEIKYKGYKDILEEHSISSGAYSNFMSSKYQEKPFEKTMYINIGFMLSLPYSIFNTLLAYGGFSVSNSTRKFDEIIDRAFRLGYGRDIAEALIVANNNILLKNHNGDCAEIPNLY